MVSKNKSQGKQGDCITRFISGRCKLGRDYHLLSSQVLAARKGTALLLYLPAVYWQILPVKKMPSEIALLPGYLKMLTAREYASLSGVLASCTRR
jgi:hypothetical protein